MARLRAKSGLYDRGIIAQASAPGSGYQGQLWFNNATGVLYQYMHDGASNFWLDISSGGIGTSAERGVDFVGDTDPVATTNGTGLAVGSVYYNREKNRHFICTNATTNSNVWVGRFPTTGGTETTYGSYKVHTFLNSGVFNVDSTVPLSCDILVVAGGGGGGSQRSGGGGAGGFRTQAGLTVVAGGYTVVVLSLIHI